MACVATTAVPTASGSRYFQQLCKYWSHTPAVEFDAAHGTVTFPETRVVPIIRAIRLRRSMRAKVRSMCD